MSVVLLQEVRQGLFRIYWNLENLTQEAGFIFRKSVQLCGSQLGKTYVITYKFDNNDSAKIPTTRIQYLYSVSVTIEETIFGEEMDAIEQSCPISIWLKGRLAKEKDVPLQKISSLKWNLKLKAHSPRKFSTLYLDFGTNTKSTRKIIEGFGKMFFNQNLCDIHFTFNDGQTIGAHVNVLSAGSPVFAAMFQSDMLESKTRHVVITDFELDVFQQLLIFLYTGNSPKLAEEDIAQRLFEAADKYGIESLKDECLSSIFKQLEMSNAISLLIWADLHSLPKLKESALNILVKNCHILCFQPDWLYFIKNHPELSLLVTQRISALVPIPTKKKSVPEKLDEFSLWMLLLRFMSVFFFVVYRKKFIY